MPTETPTSPAEQLADLLDGHLSVDEVSPEVAKLAELAGQVRTHVTLVPPTDAFREALREQVVQAATAPVAGAGPAAVPTASTVTAGSGGLSSLVAGLAATAVLATSTVAVADRAGPGDLLSGLDRAIERAQLAIADDATDADLLVEFAAERVLEALDVLDPAVVGALLADAEDLLDEALELAIAQGRSVEELLRPYAGALLTLASRTDDPAVRAQVEQRLTDLGITSPVDTGDAANGGPGTSSGGTGTGTDGGPTGDGATSGSDEGTDAGSEDPAGDVLDDIEDTVDDVEDQVDDLVDDLTDPLDDPTTPVDDLTDDATDTVDDATGQLGP